VPHSRKLWILGLTSGIGVVVVFLVVAATRIPFTSDTLRKRVVTTLADRLDAEVELDSLTLRFYPNLHAIGTGLTIRHRGRTDVPPLVSVQAFGVSATLVGLWNRRVAHVRLDGLQIQIPPGEDDNQKADTPAGAPGSWKERDKPPPASREPAAAEEQTPVENYVKGVVITELEAPDAQLVILRSDPQKPRRTWSLQTLRLRSLGMGTEMPFETRLTNAIPPGQIVAEGTFGPWQREDPGSTALGGRFTFDDADLNVFKGISGILSAKGTFDGTLDRIAVDGQTETPAFSIDVSKHAVPLSTTYHAIVDGTNGNTTLDPVNAKFFSTSLVARGGVYEVEGVDGRVVKLDVTLDEGRLEDLMRLSVPTPKPPMTGRLRLTTAMLIPPGKVNVVEKLQLDGRFAIGGGRFTNETVQQKIDEMSLRASGKLAKVETVPTVASDFTGRFSLRKGTLRLPVVTFDIPGAVVELSGQYALRQETLAFTGNLFMDAKISQTVTGIKSLLLRLADPFFRKNGRTVVPLKIEGTRSNPSFGLDMKRVFRNGDAKPTQPSSTAPSSKAPPAKVPPAKPTVPPAQAKKS